MVRIAFVGAGSVVFTRQLLRDILSYPELSDVQLSLHDIDPDRLDVAEGLARLTARQFGARPVITASADRRKALEGADVVVNMVAVGGHPATMTDFDIPRSYGLRQTIGDTLGIGGIFRALRTFPLLRGLAADMTAVCPQAWLLNYTNPMAMNLQYLTSIAPRLRALGLCHSVYWTVRDLCGIVGVPYEEVDTLSAGVNHQGWILRWEHRGRDLHPALDAALAFDPQLRRRVRMDMYQRLGYFPTETSEHSAEYVPWYLRDDGEIARLRIPLDHYTRTSAANLTEYAQVRDSLAAGRDPEPAQEEDATEYAPQVIHSLVTGERRTIQVTTANTGLITNLPTGAAVEVPATLDRLGVHPHHVGALPPQLAALNRSFLNVVELTVAAAVEEDPRHIRHAAMSDPATAATLTVPQIWALCDDMVAAHGGALPPALRGALSPGAG
ncbi:alpha-glucosidase/alpha-galactosidase [Streptomyces sp. RKAG293]|uniref:alpha-glucosidase/alpha-galactosidase n=1 Tax=Streptomyces sp. RKAG293 TaxID=2893403 RepID=UPI00203370B3|nr:alpha-glucosidase/alpha-galactosidase [Streptomyces sp. RKAG293]MCM2422783.1 alpha-glucosidase/alpha-galactosidase [Streptomyces sp. RKAG293]